MIIKHIETGIESKITYKEWISKYVKKDIYKKYEIINSSDVVELHRILQNGEVRKSVFDIEESNKLIKRFPNEFRYVDNTFKYCDKYLVNKSTSINQSFFSNVNAFWNNIPTLKKIREYIITSTTSKLLGNIVFWLFITIVGGLAVLIIWAIFKNDLIKIFQ